MQKRLFQNLKLMRFSKLTICGHSEGSLVGMMSVKEKHQYISLAGVGESANEVLKSN
ncbi:MAG: hypothetical protein IPJ31_15580 [Bacteroidetes bacterium]|nr:hypothetical protein [Bacteroidota bacterium]